MKPRPQWVIIAMGAAALLFAGAAPAQAPAQTPDPGTATLMKAIVYHDYGSPDVLRLEAIAKPVPNDNQLLIRVHAVSVNPLDWHYMRGTPYVMRMGTGLLAPNSARLGVDFAGTVEAVGRSVTKFKPGDEVFGGRNGAFAEFVCVREDGAVVPKPGNITFEQAASVPIAAITALQGLRDKGKVQPGTKVLINGASGGVGTFAVQIAKAFGAEVTGVCSTRNLDLVRSLGADHVIDYTREDFTQGGLQYDLILDMVGTHALSEYKRALTPKGIYVLIGSTDKGLWLGPIAGIARSAVYSRFVSQDMGFMMADMNQPDLAVLADLMQAGKVTPVIDRRYRLGQVPEAIAYLEEGHARGKVVIDLDAADDTAPSGAASAPTAVRAIGPGLMLLAVVALVIGAPIVVALALNRGFRRRNPGKRSYRWGYYLGIQSLLAGTGLGVMIESGVVAAIVCGVLYAVLAWCFMRRQHWAWVTLTLLTLNPVVWIINLIYLKRRWAEDAAPARTAG